MEQDFTLHPLLDGLLIRDVLEVLVKVAELVNIGQLVAVPLGVIIEDDFPTQLVDPQLRVDGHRVLIPGVEGDIVKDFFLNFGDEIYECFHGR